MSARLALCSPSLHAGLCALVRPTPLGLSASATHATILRAGAAKGGKKGAGNAKASPKKPVTINTKKGAASGSAASAADKKETQSQRKKDEMLIRALRGVPTEYKEYRTPEELAQCMEIAKEYSRQMMRAHIAQCKDLTAKIRLKEAAIARMPQDLLDAADRDDEKDTFPLPVYPGLPTLTPPTKPTFGHMLE
eukprot:TRINITY_DN15761_c0_g1_i1.p2 TRINITY_DN15761_c0_g1~~TRINITY_DN15761_c0_g1_i1.p2  ORF type:complete len:193 (-),score=40.75 TRINITY_DN15761_c0_g1_i1:131-709(-)